MTLFANIIYNITHTTQYYSHDSATPNYNRPYSAIFDYQYINSRHSEVIVGGCQYLISRSIKPCCMLLRFFELKMFEIPVG